MEILRINFGGILCWEWKNKTGNVKIITVTSCDLDAKGPDTKTVSWSSFIRLFEQCFFKTSSVSCIEFNYLVWQPPG